MSRYKCLPVTIYLFSAFFGVIGPAVAAPLDALSSLTHVQIVVLPLISLMLALLLIQARQRARELAAAEASHRVLSEYGSEIVLRVSLEGRVLYASPAICEALGWLPEELVGEDCASIVHAEDRLPFDVAARQMTPGSDALTFTHRLRRRNGSHTWFESRSHVVCDQSTAEPCGFVIVSHDVSRQRRAEHALESANNKLHVLSRTDALTELPNRRWFDETVSTELLRASRSALPLSLLLIDIDHMRQFNDRFGYPAGDEYLRSIATVVGLQGQRPGDFAARFNGDCFGVVLPDTDIAGAVLLAERIRAGVEQLPVVPCEQDGTAGSLTVSVGAACFDPGRSGFRERLDTLAERALQNAKKAGRNTVRVAPILDRQMAHDGHRLTPSSPLARG